MPVDLHAVPHSPQQEFTSTAQAAYKQGFEDFQYFSRLAVPSTIIFNWPPEYIAIFTMLVKAVLERDKAKIGLYIRFALGLPRGFAKTTFIKVLVCWLVIYAEIDFILVVCATEPLSENFLADVNDILGSYNMETVYGTWRANLAVDNAQLKKASYRQRLIILAAIGSNTSVRGLNIGNARPNMIICDDMQTKENAESDAESLRLLTWFTGTLLKIVSPFFAMVVYIGNMYPQNCILLKLQENPYWTSLVTGCILADGKSLWEELKPIEALYKDYCHDEAMGLAYIWFAEMMNQPLLEKISLLPLGTIPQATLTINELVPEAGFAIIDPSGFKKASDDNVIGFFLVCQGIPYMVKLIADTLNPKDVIEKTILGCALFNIRVIFVEGVAYQSTLRFWFNELLGKAGLANHYMISEVSPKNRAKEGRIRVSVQQLLSKTWWIVCPEARQRYLFQALAYKLGKPNNKDDILDVGAYVEDVRDPENWALVNSLPLNAQEQAKAMVVGNNTPF